MYHMTMLQKQAVQMIQDMSDDNVGFLIEVIQRLIPKKTYTSVIYPSQKPAEQLLQECSEPEPFCSKQILYKTL